MPSILQKLFLNALKDSSSENTRKWLFSDSFGVNWSIKVQFCAKFLESPCTVYKAKERVCIILTSLLEEVTIWYDHLYPSTLLGKRSYNFSQ